MGSGTMGATASPEAIAGADAEPGEDADDDPDARGPVRELDPEASGDGDDDGAATADRARGAGDSPDSLSQAATHAASTRAKPEARTSRLLPRAAHLHFLINWPGVHLGVRLGLVLGGVNGFMS